MGGINFGCLTVWIQGPSWFCRKMQTCDFFRRLCEAAERRAGECGPCPDFASNTVVFVLKLRKNHGKTSVGLTEGLSAFQCRTRFDYSTWPSRKMASTGLLSPATLGFRARRRVQTSVSLSIRRFAVLGCSPQQITLKRISRSGQ